VRLFDFNDLIFKFYSHVACPSVSIFMSCPDYMAESNHIVQSGRSVTKQINNTTQYQRVNPTGKLYHMTHCLCTDITRSAR